jgi:predicted ATPase
VAIMLEVTIIIGMATSSRATNGAAGGPIFGRERKLAHLELLVDGVSERGAALLVRGEPGIGKSTLLAVASRRAENAGMRVLRATGVQPETQLPFAGLHQLVLPVLGQADLLPTPQQVALLAAFGMEEVAEAPDFSRQKFDSETGDLVDEETRKRLRRFLTALVEWARRFEQPIRAHRERDPGRKV